MTGFRQVCSARADMRRLSKRGSVAVVFLLVVVCSTSIAEADPVTVTAGRLNLHEWVDFDFRGEGFRLAGTRFDEPMPSGLFPFEDCLICTAGASIRLGTNLQEHELASSVGVTVFNNQTYGDVFYSGNLRFDAPIVTVPDTGEPFLDFVRPFTLTGTLVAFGSPDRTGSPLFSTDLRGAGNVRFSIHEGVPGQYNFTDLTYTFDTAAPVPEPATMTLVGSFIGGLLLRARRRKKIVRS